MRDHLGLFDAPSTRRESRFVVVLAVALFAIVCLILPVRNVPMGEVSSFVPTINAITLATELIVAALLYAQATVFRSRALTVLASGYVLSALLLIPHALSFPGAFAPEGVLGGGVSSTAWLAAFRRFAFPFAAILYAVLKWREVSGPGRSQLTSPNIPLGIAAAFAIAGLATILAIAGHDLLPPFFTSKMATIPAMQLGIGLLAAVLTLCAMAYLLRPGRTLLDLWLLLGLSFWLAQAVILMWLRARYTLGFYSLYGFSLVSSLVVMIALIVESNRLYVRLALSSAARERERAARMMSMNAVAAALAHEIGQPLTAISLNSSAALGYLTAKRPNLGKAIESLHQVQDGRQLAFEVVKSVRGMFSNGSDVRTCFDLNDLTRETMTLLDQEISAHKVSLELSLDPDLPEVMANRVQLQRILINLVTNALEAMDEIRGPRHLVIRTVRTETGDALIELTDSGVGIPADKAIEIFEPFVTTKRTGTGLGLHLCRTIVEDHGGKLWATSGQGRGATFHLQVPQMSARHSIEA